MKVSTYVMAGLLVGTILTTSTVSAEDGVITDTGPGSNNEININLGKSCYVTNDNNIYLTDTNEQIGTSGTATDDDNTEGGNAQTGEVSNDNDVKIRGTVDNAGGCVAAVTSSTPTPTPAPTPQQSGKVEAAQVQAPVGGVKAGAGSTDTTGVLVGLLAAGVAAIGVGLRKLHALKQS